MLKALRRLPVQEWSYKPGEGDGRSIQHWTLVR